MKSDAIFNIGSACLDVIDPHEVREQDIVFRGADGQTYVPGGPVLFAADVFRKMGYAPVILTPGDQNHPFYREISERLGVPLFVTSSNEQLASGESPNPIFDNKFVTADRRVLYNYARGHKITPENLQRLGIKLPVAATIFLGSVFNEMSADLVQHIRNQIGKDGRIIGTLQGWLRTTDAEYVVRQEPSDELLEALGLMDLAVYSREDLEGLPSYYREELLRRVPFTVITNDVEGADIYSMEGETRHVHALPMREDLAKVLYDPLSKEERRRALTGNGDFYTAVIITSGVAEGSMTIDTVAQAAREASILTTLKIEQGLLGGEGGITGSPTKATLNRYRESPEGRARLEQYTELYRTQEGLPPGYTR